MAARASAPNAAAVKAGAPRGDAEPCRAYSGYAGTPCSWRSSPFSATSWVCGQSPLRLAMYALLWTARDFRSRESQMQIAMSGPRPTEVCTLTDRAFSGPAVCSRPEHRCPTARHARRSESLGHDGQQDVKCQQSSLAGSVRPIVFANRIQQAQYHTPGDGADVRSEVGAHDSKSPAGRGATFTKVPRSVDAILLNE